MNVWCLFVHRTFNRCVNFHLQRIHKPLVDAMSPKSTFDGFVFFFSLKADLMQTGVLEWPEFLSLMSQSGRLRNLGDRNVGEINTKWWLFRANGKLQLPSVTRFTAKFAS